MAQRYFVQLAYRGTHYRGWQRQTDGTPSVQQTIEGALSQVQRESVKATGCGRTDAGVHASEYYLHFDTERGLRDDWLFVMHKQLPPDIVFHRVWPVDRNAHARYDARERTYDYFIHTRPDPFLAVVSGEYTVDEDRIQEVERALMMLVGRRDFRAFCLTPDRHNTTVCDLRQASFHREGEGRYRFRFVADRFLRGMIRILVYQLLRVGAGRLRAQQIERAIASGRRLSLGQARPEGLFLSGIAY